MKVAHEICCGIDVHAKMLVVCLLLANGEKEIRTFSTMTDDLLRLRDWLVAAQCTHVAIESTGVYWKPVFNVLEDTVKVYVANPQEVKVRKGHKTDDKDGWWLAHLLRHAMIHPSFIPPRAIRELRDLTRRRKKLLGAGSPDAALTRNNLGALLSARGRCGEAAALLESAVATLERRLEPGHPHVALARANLLEATGGG